MEHASGNNNAACGMPCLQCLSLISSEKAFATSVADVLSLYSVWVVIVEIWLGDTQKNC